jgi:hypothetical protein
MGGGASKLLSCGNISRNQSDDIDHLRNDGIEFIDRPNGPSITVSNNLDGNRPTSIIIDSPSHSTPRRDESDLISQGREKALYSFVVKTPTADLTHIYKYYCPLCTLYYEDIFRSNCCGNYSCVVCTTQYLEKRGMKVITPTDILMTNESTNTPCPTCNSFGFAPRLVALEERARDYSFSTKISCETENSDKQYSPIKIGDDYEALIRKMQPFPDITKQLEFDDTNGDSSNNTIMENNIINKDIIHQLIHHFNLNDNNENITMVNEKSLSIQTIDVETQATNIHHDEIVEPILTSN